MSSSDIIMLPRIGAGAGGGPTLDCAGIDDQSDPTVNAKGSRCPPELGTTIAAHIDGESLVQPLQDEKKAFTTFPAHTATSSISMMQLDGGHIANERTFPPAIAGVRFAGSHEHIESGGHSHSHAPTDAASGTVPNISRVCDLFFRYFFLCYWLGLLCYTLAITIAFAEATPQLCSSRLLLYLFTIITTIAITLFILAFIVPAFIPKACVRTHIHNDSDSDNHSQSRIQNLEGRAAVHTLSVHGSYVLVLAGLIGYGTFAILSNSVDSNPSAASNTGDSCDSWIKSTRILWILSVALLAFLIMLILLACANCIRRMQLLKHYALNRAFIHTPWIEWLHHSQSHSRCHCHFHRQPQPFQVPADTLIPSSAQGTSNVTNFRSGEIVLYQQRSLAAALLCRTQSKAREVIFQRLASYEQTHKSGTKLRPPPEKFGDHCRNAVAAAISPSVSASPPAVGVISGVSVATALAVVCEVGNLSQRMTVPLTHLSKLPLYDA